MTVAGLTVVTLGTKGEASPMPPHVKNMTLEELEERREQILATLGMSYEELAARADSRSLIGDEWTAWEEIREIDFLLNR